MWEATMSFRRWVLSLSTLLVAACSDGTAPLSAPSQAPGPHFLQWTASSAPQFEAVGAVTDGTTLVPGAVLFSLDGNLPSPSVSTYKASFWAVRGKTRGLQINYVSNGGKFPFMGFTTTDPIYVPGRGNLALGDSVLITVSVDSTKFAVYFAPSGLQFGTPAALTLFYGGLAGDLNGDGVVNSTDASVEANLRMYTQAKPGGAWTPVPAIQSSVLKSISTIVPHFSGYGVSW
jgi:hypothetical protein